MMMMMINYVILYPIILFSHHQAQISHLGSSIHSRTPYPFRVPESTAPTFWVINMLLLVIPQLLAWRCTNYPEFFVKQEEEEVRNGKVKVN